MTKSLVTRFVLFAMLSFTVAVMGCSSSDGGAAGSGGTAGTGGGGTGGDGGMGGGGMGGMAGEGGMGGMGGGIAACVEDLCVDALPSGRTFDPSISVELIVSGPDSAGATIYYTTDLTDPESGSPEYSGPINLTDTTVVKFRAVASGAGGAGGAGGAPAPSDTGEKSEGYTLAEGPAASIYEEWATSGHGDITATPWRRWDPGPVSTGCAQCHSAAGFLDYALDGTVTEANPPSLGLECSACHTGSPSSYFNPAFTALEPVEFPSGAELTEWGSSNMCMVCHQGRESGQDVKDEIEGDMGAGPYGFTNIHYYAAAASLFGSEAGGGFEYEDEEYRPRNTFPSHPDNFSTCEGCHMQNAEGGEPHTWRPSLESCQSCHSGSTFETLGGSPAQSYTNIQTLSADLYAAIQTYAENDITGPMGEDGWPITYEDRYPYFFDQNGDRYSQFDATLLPAAYNYQVGQKDPAGFVHNGTYIQQLLYDSIMDVGGSTTVQVAGRGGFALDGADIGSASKTQQWQISGHADAASEVFRHWDEDGAVSGSCSKCHSTPGFVEFAMGQPTTSHVPLSTVDCTSCHNQFDLFSNPETRWNDLTTNPALDDVEFPSGESVNLNNNSNICMSCHQGRSSTDDVNDATSNGENDPLYDSYSFINIHYYAAGATLFGNDVRGGYQYAGETYRGLNPFGVHTNLPDAVDLVDCIGCHMNADDAEAQKHTFLPKIEDCSTCHVGSTFPTMSGSPSNNFDDIQTLKADLLAAIEAYANTGDPGTGLPKDSPIQYNGSAYPYWFKDGVPPIYPNRYLDFDFDMLTAAYNFVVADKDPGGYIHNGAYIKQILFDSIVEMGGTPSIARP